MGHSGDGVALTATVPNVLRRVLAELISPPGRDDTTTHHPGSLFALFEQVWELADQSKQSKIVRFGAMSSGKARGDDYRVSSYAHTAQDGTCIGRENSHPEISIARCFPLLRSTPSSRAT